MENVRILGLDISGNPFKWLTPEEAVHYYASDKVVWELGEDIQTFHGGFQRASGDRSLIVTKSIIAIRGEMKIAPLNKETINTHGNYLLFRRDHHMCAYCGDEFEGRDLTRDHVYPRARGGTNDWINSVTACQSCNRRKACRTPEEAGMVLRYLPYRPCRWETFILQNRNVIVDQMEYLKSKLPKHSRYN
jgi:hypothetical protein